MLFGRSFGFDFGASCGTEPQILGPYLLLYYFCRRGRLAASKIPLIFANARLMVESMCPLDLWFGLVTRVSILRKVAPRLGVSTGLTLAESVLGEERSDSHKSGLKPPEIMHGVFLGLVLNF